MSHLTSERIDRQLGADVVIALARRVLEVDTFSHAEVEVIRLVVEYGQVVASWGPTSESVIVALERVGVLARVSGSAILSVRLAVACRREWLRRTEEQT